jgi:hypothetical protein
MPIAWTDIAGNAGEALFVDDRRLLHLAAYPTATAVDPEYSLPF